jgi:hypothetical protein
MALGKEAEFLYSAIPTYTNDAQKENRSDLVDVWNTIKQDRQRHLQTLKDVLEREAKENRLNQ